MSQKENTVSTQETAITTADKKALSKFEDLIMKSYLKRNSAMLDIAGAITAIHARELYKIGGYKNIYDYTREKYDISRGSTANCISVIVAFGVPETGKIADKWSEFTFGQLTRMAKLPDGQLLNVTPETTTRELDEQLRANKAKVIESKEETKVDETPDTTPEEVNEPDDQDVDFGTVELLDELETTKLEVEELKERILNITEGAEAGRTAMVVTHVDQVYESEFMISVKEALLAGLSVTITLIDQESEVQADA